jgi:hypothetical protein
MVLWLVSQKQRRKLDGTRPQLTYARCVSRFAEAANEDKDRQVADSWGEAVGAGKVKQAGRCVGCWVHGMVCKVCAEARGGLRCGMLSTHHESAAHGLRYNSKRMLLSGHYAMVKRVDKYDTKDVYLLACIFLLHAPASWHPDCMRAGQDGCGSQLGAFATTVASPGHTTRAPSLLSRTCFGIFESLRSETGFVLKGWALETNWSRSASSAHTPPCTEGSTPASSPNAAALVQACCCQAIPPMLAMLLLLHWP